MAPCGTPRFGSGDFTACMELNTANPQLGDIFKVTDLSNLTGPYAPGPINQQTGQLIAIGDLWELREFKPGTCASGMLPTHPGLTHWELEPKGCEGSPDGAQVEMCICDCPPSPIGPAGGCSSNYTCPNSSQMSSAYLTIGGQTPQVGDKLYSDCIPQVYNHQSCTWEITAVGNLGTAMGDRQPSNECDQVNENRGCLNPNAINYNQCCNQDPHCTPVISDPECCRFEHEPDQKGCLDSTASNYMTCCDLTIPGCTPTIQYDECCKYDRDPEPCETYITPNDPDWGHCSECFAGTAAGPNNAHNSTMAAITGWNCECCKEEVSEEIECQCCKGGYPVSVAQSVPANPGCSVLNGTSGFSNCQTHPLSGGPQTIDCEGRGSGGEGVGAGPPIDKGLREILQRRANIKKK